MYAQIGSRIEFLVYYIHNKIEELVFFRERARSRDQFFIHDVYSMQWTVQTVFILIPILI